MQKDTAAHALQSSPAQVQDSSHHRRPQQSARRQPKARPNRDLKILLLGNYRPSITLARVLKNSGHAVYCGYDGFEGGAEYSNTIQEMWRHPSFEDDPNGFFLELKAFVQAKNIDIVYPVTEDFVCALAERFEVVSSLVAIAMHEPSQVDACTDKLGMYDRAQRLGVPTNIHAMVETAQQLQSTLSAIGTPLVVRPENPVSRFDNKKVFTIENDRDANWLLEHWNVGETRLLCQRFARGHRHNVYFAAEKGQVFRYLQAKILKTDIADGSGLATEGITVAPDAELRRHTEAMLADLDYTGIGCAQFLVDEDTGEISFLEINTRIAGNHAVPEAAGLELTEVPIALAFGEPLNFARKEGRVGLSYVWTSGAIMGAKVGWIRGDLSAIRALGWILRALYKSVFADIHMVFSWRDPKPAVMSILACLPSVDGIFKRLKRR